VFVPAQRRPYCTSFRSPRIEAPFMARNMHRLRAKTSPGSGSLPYKIAALREAHLTDLSNGPSRRAEGTGG
jgi:hypothetical protein